MGEATLDSSEVKTITKVVVGDVHLLDGSLATVNLKYKYDDGSVARNGVVHVRSSDEDGFATPDAFEAFLVALSTPLNDEVGSVSRRANYRILSHLVDVGALEGVTVAP